MNIQMYVYNNFWFSGGTNSLSFFSSLFFFLALNENTLMCVGKVVIILTSLIKTIEDLYINHIKLIHLSGDYQ